GGRPFGGLGKGEACRLFVGGGHAVVFGFVQPVGEVFLTVVQEHEFDAPGAVLASPRVPYGLAGLQLVGTDPVDDQFFQGGAGGGIFLGAHSGLLGLLGDVVAFLADRSKIGRAHV